MISAKRWTQQEDDTLRQMYAGHTRAQIAAAIGRREAQVRSRCWTLGLNSKMDYWSDAEVARLREVYGGMADPFLTVKQLAVELGRDQRNVSRKARSFGLTNPHRGRVKNRKIRIAKFPDATERNANTGAAMKARIAANGHPRGMLGKTHTEETKAKMGAASRAMWADPASAINSEALKQLRSDSMVRRILAGEMKPKYTRCVGGRRPDLGDTYFRSAWEANYARYLNLLISQKQIASWEYEAKTFWFERIKRGTRCYTPDFRVTMNDGRVEWHEVKGWMDPKSKTRLDRMGRYFPEETVKVFGEAWFRDAHRNGLSAVVPGWESKQKRTQGAA